MPIDHFLQTLAEDRGVSAIGVILSGSASDGTVGLKAIKAEGGITFAQDEHTAKYASMPMSAVAADCVDFVQPPDQIAKELTRMGCHPYVGGPNAAPVSESLAAAEANLNKIHLLLRSSTGTDFRDYKPGTINRRIRRRMALAKSEDLGHYTVYLQSHPQEVRALFHDILIHVTQFFREPETFATLKSKVFPKLQASLAPGQAIRIWVPGCSSGEEAYSIAMALIEFLGDEGDQMRVQVFGSDISERDIEKARAGVYTQTDMAGISPERLRRFFIKVEGGYQIVKSVREVCVFARHDLPKDPPFSRLDLISCHNVLIYFGPGLQKRVMAIFHYALKPSGYLLLGQSESISGFSNLFALADRRAKAYLRKAAPTQMLFDVPAVDDAGPATTRRRDQEATLFDLRKEGQRVLLARYAPPGFFVDMDMNIVHFQGDTSPFLRPTPGEATFQLLKMVRPELMLELRSAIDKAKKQGGPVRNEGVEVERNGSTSRYDLDVVPVKDPRAEATNFLVLFNEPRQTGPTTAPRPRDKSPRKKTQETKEIERLQRELTAAQEFLRTVTEDQEASEEELRTANEEILSSNEELQTTNEELETAKEEMQSSNEELSTLNEELQNRNHELDQLASDLSNLLTGVEIPIVILGGDLRIRRFTPPAEKLLNFVPSDIGRPIGHIKPGIHGANLEELAAEVIRTGQVVEQEVRDNEGRSYSLRMRPFKSAENKIDSVLLALVDITEMKQAEAEGQRDREATISALLENAAQGIIAIDEQGRIKVINSMVEVLFGYNRNELLGQTVEILLPDRFRGTHSKHREEFLAQPRVRPMGIGLDLFGLRKDGSEFPIEVSLSHIESRQGRLAIGFISNVAERKKSEEQLGRNRRDLQALTRKLIATQEDRYRDLARELHDVFNQRLAALGILIGEIKGQAPLEAQGLQAI